MTARKAVYGGALAFVLLGRLILYPYGIVWDATLPWEISGQTCRDIGIEFSPVPGLFVNEC